MKLGNLLLVVGWTVIQPNPTPRSADGKFEVGEMLLAKPLRIAAAG